MCSVRLGTTLRKSSALGLLALRMSCSSLTLLGLTVVFSKEELDAHP